MLHFDKIHDEAGYLVLTEDGSVISSGGDLENDERIADILANLLSLADTVDPCAFGPGEGIHRLTVSFNDFAYVMCLSNKRMYIVKKRVTPADVEATAT